MAQFRGVIQGARGPASRLGHKGTGLTVEAQSWQGKVTVRLWHDSQTGTDRVSVWLAPHYGGGTTLRLYDGPVGGPVEG